MRLFVLTLLLVAMEHTPEVLSEGEHPIYLYPSYDGTAKLIAHAETEMEGSQAWSESHDESALSSPSDEQVPVPRLGGDEIESSPAVLSADRKLLAAFRFKEGNNTAVRRNRTLGDDLVSNPQTSSNGDESDEGQESFGKTESESESSHSSGSDDAESDGDLQVAQAGQQFQDRDGPNPDVAEDSDIDLDAVVSRHILGALSVQELIRPRIESTRQQSQRGCCCTI